MSSPKRLAIFNCKGGVGKTTTTLNLGAAFEHGSYPVRLIDFDPQAHLSRIYGHQKVLREKSCFVFLAGQASLRTLEVAIPETARRLLPAHGSMMKADSMFGKGPAALRKLNEGLLEADALDPRATLIDCCPYIGVLSLGAIFAADLVLVPVGADYLSMNGAEQIDQALGALEKVLKRRVARRYVLTRFDRRRTMSNDVQARMYARFGDELCTTVIRENVALATSPLMGCDVFKHQTQSAGAQDYAALFRELQGAHLI